MSQVSPSSLLLNMQIEGNFQSESQRLTAGSKSKVGGFLMALAEALGKQIDAAAEDLKQFSESLGKNPTAEQTTELTARSQMFSLFMNNASTVIKTVGEANAAMARKQ
ncbi:hypothetical protein [Coralloluteibacterium stylophorae]|uniref:Uncharacterized protein n=1 Tax=Coralloluteibacterium stylophorae TaxID=1776034 RepID=A0A8J7VVK2_9GAMM|nr:hypothetical protein [Coralloluteibacterium stylophorae]MBS7458789.1 hypothetical protein [Coralloluteibacterium stylophorae]